jgi:hypothetical protein
MTPVFSISLLEMQLRESKEQQGSLQQVLHVQKEQAQQTAELIKRLRRKLLLVTKVGIHLVELCGAENLDSLVLKMVEDV